MSAARTSSEPRDATGGTARIGRADKRIWHSRGARFYPREERLFRDLPRLIEEYVLPGGLAFCMLGPSDPVPDRYGDLVLQRELGYRLPFSRAQRRVAIFQRKP